MYGIGGIELQLFHDFLNNRKQFVSWNGSDSRKLTCGLPQGSILGPLLFITYVNDLYLVSKNMFFIIFADDTHIFFMSNRNYEDIITQINAELVQVNLWFQKNKLSLNIKKTSYMLVTPKNKKKYLLIKMSTYPITLLLECNMPSF